LIDCSIGGVEADQHVPDALGPAGRRQATVLDAILARGGVTIGELIDGLGLPRSTAKSALAGLRSRGLIRMLGAGRDASYVPTPLGLAVPPVSRPEAGNGRG
jgi:predicted transcriptional regulator